MLQPPNNYAGGNLQFCSEPAEPFMAQVPRLFKKGPQPFFRDKEIGRKLISLSFAHVTGIEALNKRILLTVEQNMGGLMKECEP